MISLIGVTRKTFSRFKEQILKIERASFPSPWSARQFEEETGNPVSHLWVLTVGGILEGYVAFQLYCAEIHLLNIAVDLESRGSGFGRYLLDKMIELGISQGVEKVWLEVRPSNLRARRLYEKAGFKEVGRRPGYYRDTREDAIIMSLSLPGVRRGCGQAPPVSQRETGYRGRQMTNGGLRI